MAAGKNAGFSSLLSPPLVNYPRVFHSLVTDYIRFAFHGGYLYKKMHIVVSQKRRKKTEKILSRLNYTLTAAKQKALNGFCKTSAKLQEHSL